MTTKSDEQERVEFEAWYREKYNSTLYCEARYEGWVEGRAALQSQDREDAIPANIRLMAERIAADTFEHCTADPIFTVQKKRIVTGLDTDCTDNIGWFDTDSGDLVEGDEAADLEARYDDTGDEPEGYVRTGYFEEWEHYATYITMESAQEFAKAKGENCRVYVDSGYRNHEWKALRAFLLSIDHARRIEGDGE
ncbi:hypothetical protein [Pusillimonas noertemannii]|uniref:Uncharacterized protein n=1 Tax=Pusillimonas noertemannii TaxID=305977 RepID=A0A2U1CRS0_9BURK|nr:hypothetical protein [Pusillimonas noertemannii]NYT67929.1 hypothetical protein [Pusillimonas noertemannii]PVY68600.1 hypothetical protein C7440_1011 [Pusillimonas noertemannii]TFL11928.1 hypothetical protein CSC72_02000 [Pusillimonas noertemannii]